MKVVSINNKSEEQQEKFWEEHQAKLLEVLDEMRERVQNRDLTEFVACSLDANGTAVLHASGCDYVTGVGLYEVGKNIFIRYMEDWEEE